MSVFVYFTKSCPQHILTHGPFNTSYATDQNTISMVTPLSYINILSKSNAVQKPKMFWGLTPALDLLKEYKCVTNQELPEEVNILIVGSSDCRHILLTLANRFQHKKVRINFYIVEACLEIIARQLLLLNITLQPHEALGLEQKTRMFMELHGNTLLRPSVAKYLSSAAVELLKMITNFDYLQQMMSCVQLDIKHKERDYLENVLKFWYGKEEFNILEYWNTRLRKFLGIRYDSRVGAFDWDLYMRLHNIGGKQICSQEYRNFRMKGLAFAWMESEASKPNRSLVCALIPNGETFAHYGYLGDMQSGPFIAFGLSCEDKDFLKSTHGQNAYRATDVTERNLKQVFYEIHNKKKYVHSVDKMQLGSLVLKEENLVIDNNGADLLPGAVKKCVNLEDVNINFISISALDKIKYKEKYQKIFDIIYYGCAFLKYFDKDLMEKVTKNKVTLLIENVLFTLTNRKKELEEFADEITQKLEGLQSEKVEFDPEKDFYAKYLLTSS